VLLQPLVLAGLTDQTYSQYSLQAKVHSRKTHVLEQRLATWSQTLWADFGYFRQKIRILSVMAVKVFGLKQAPNTTQGRLIQNYVRLVALPLMQADFVPRGPALTRPKQNIGEQAAADFMVRYLLASMMAVFRHGIQTAQAVPLPADLEDGHPALLLNLHADQIKYG
jgi:hypothetical protein